MAAAKVTTVRFASEDLAIIEAVQERTGLFSQADALRYILRQYAQANGIDFKQKTKAKPKR